MVVGKVSPKDLEKFYRNVNQLCEEIFDSAPKSAESEGAKGGMLAKG